MKLSLRKNSLLFALLCCLILLGVQRSFSTEIYPFSSCRDIEKLFAEKGYTADAWEKGIREIPPIYLTRIPRSWKDKYSREVSVVEKKNLFFRMITPGILYCNRQILTERTKLKNLVEGKSSAYRENSWILQLGKKYGVVDEGVTTITGKHLIELLQRVDIVPPAIALAQGADESGWGTSRFAVEGESLFGQWTWDGKGIASRGHQAGKGDYEIAEFAHLRDSIAAYMLNLNTHSSYGNFRTKRAQLRKAGKKISVMVLVDTLIMYSQRGESYVRDLKNLIRHNNLAVTDDACLIDEEAIELKPRSEKR